MYNVKQNSYIKSQQQLVKLNIRFRNLLKHRKRYTSANTSRYFFPNKKKIK